MNRLMGIFSLSLWLVCASSASASAGELPDWISRRLHKRELVDLHNGEFCVDVSTFGDIQYNPVSREKCDSTFSKQCEDKSKNVCDEVTELECEIVPYTECRMIMEKAPYTSYKTVTKQYMSKKCNEGTKVVQHTKMMPECRNVTKQNCITKWETDENGNQVWAGNEACEPVTWRECELVPRIVDFKIPKMECANGTELPYQDIEDEEKEEMTTNMLCDVKHSANCTPKVSTKCKDITYQECKDVPEEVCETVDIQVPFQEKEHKKKCLLPDDGTFGRPAGVQNPAGDGNGAGAALGAAAAVPALASAIEYELEEDEGEVEEFPEEEDTNLVTLESQNVQSTVVQADIPSSADPQHAYGPPPPQRRGKKGGSFNGQFQQQQLHQLRLQQQRNQRQYQGQGNFLAFNRRYLQQQQQQQEGGNNGRRFAASNRS